MKMTLETLSLLIITNFHDDFSLMVEPEDQVTSELPDNPE